MESTNLLKILHGNIDLIDHVNVRDIALFEVDITIYPKDVRAILRRYLSGEISSDDLNKWAEFICIRAEYSCPGWEDDETADFYEAMMYVIQRLSTPEIDGEITKERVAEYFHELDKYGDDE